ncbi:uncharacterized protein SPAPADRAFT_71503 [Spathaspora passalidarum NRRL Y-27907]|uniref:Ras modification protein ERF4 n=1 Tax=Spathaspora passalidarum (strain NRRL Y-27907 / 11-Y1) TaxID=619300 RepID=G3ANH0_SPAPN|nr:uncharacterized protein SPAPADRAFT_71503 [Spathaspora passalidarum NRRL Y-27907]EGW31959.1 hypothetical protein SPAPADRAFT_71503 [Spathaspora passalidarum NRRL Y-27907]
MSTTNDNNSNPKLFSSGPSTSEPNDLSFFNYHEFLVPQSKYSLVINHYPNNYASSNSTTQLNTRIIRIPRCYETTEFSDLIPSFSLYYPGKEPGAITQEHLDVQGTYDGNIFGITSDFRLEINSNELQEIVRQVNQYLYNAFYPYSIPTLFENVLDLITGGMFSQLSNLVGVRSHTKRTLLQLEQYITDVNSKFKEREIDVVIISPRKSGYLSVCIAFCFAKVGILLTYSLA